MPDPAALVRAIFSEPRNMVGFLGPGGSEMLAAMTTDDIEFEFVGPPAYDTGLHELQGTHRGHGALIQAWRGWLEVYASYVVTLESVHPLDEDSVLTLVEVVARTATGDVELRQRQGALFAFRGERIRRWQAWLHADDARAAFGIG